MKLNKRSVDKKLVAAVIAAVLLLAGAGAYAMYYKSQHTPNITNSSKDTPGDNINYSAPTENDTAESQDAKKKLLKQEQGSAGSEVQVGIANYFVSDSSVEIRAFTPSVVEGGGICTATLTQADKKVTGNSEAFIDASTSQCRPIIISLSNFSSKGTWKLQVSYKSDKYFGTSPTMEINL